MKPSALCRLAQLFARATGEGCSDAERANAWRKLDAQLHKHAKNRNDIPQLLVLHQTQPDHANTCPLRSAQSSPAPDPRDADPQPHPFTDPNFTPVGVVHGILEQYVALQPHEYVAVALWAIHTHVYDHFMVTPRLFLTSPVRGCGKTVLLDVLSRLVARPKQSDNATAAALYHYADKLKCTLLLDEADNLDLPAKAALRAVLNGGHRKGRKKDVMVRGQPQEFNLFTPSALAGIGSLPLPLMHRSIVIRMIRHDGLRLLRRFDSGDSGDLDIVYSYIRSWVQRATINPDPDMPAELHNRHGDNWRPLIAVADACSPEWGARAREAAIAFSRAYRDEDIAVMLLHHVRQVFDVRGVDRILGKLLVEDLVAMDDVEWSEWRGLQGDQQPRKLTQAMLATLLRPFGIRPHSIWPLQRQALAGAKSGKGYLRSQFEAVWRAYCDEGGTAAHASKIICLPRA
jgi:hypothetical protein